jgi:hypothetical protein
MSTQLHTVTLTDLGSYQIVVAADTHVEAERIAKGVLLEEATTLPADVRIITREVDASVTIADQPKSRCPTSALVRQN